ncbi:uncharacterized protein LOC135123078 [Zophobas morio]|uniref:uncharacterized protein LOC135123078 n=1 Tax=Zophobas morio TaxID=2755281 RepID=UPI00308347A7
MKCFRNILAIQDRRVVEDLTEAIKNNNVANFKNLFSKSLNRERNEDGFTLLQEAMYHNRREIFDYLLQFQRKDDLEVRNAGGETALASAIDFYNKIDDYYALTLIEKGVSLEVKDGYTTYLHEAVRFSPSITKLLLDKGVDVNITNRSGGTAIFDALVKPEKDNNDEIIATLLYYGADPFSEFVIKWNAFEQAVLCGQGDFIQELLFLYTFDEHIPGDIMFKVLLRLAKQKSPLFHKIFEYDVDFLLGDETRKQDFAEFLYDLFAIENDYLEILVEKCDTIIGEIFENLLICNSVQDLDIFLVACYDKYAYEKVFSTNLTLKKLVLLLEKNEVVSQNVVDFIGALHSSELFGWISNMNNKSTTIELFVYLILHGLQVDTKLPEFVFNKYGYCDLFKLLLHLDVDNDTKLLSNKITRNLYNYSGCLLTPRNRSVLIPPNSRFRTSVLHFICDVTSNLNLSTENCGAFNTDVLEYFACPELYKLILHLAENGKLSDEALKRIKNHPRVSLLTEISRNVFRKYFVTKLKITTTKQFYSLLNGLPISATHKKIITFETKLYNV